MIAKIIACVVVVTASLSAMPPPMARPGTPPVSLIRIVEVAAARAREIDDKAYAGEARFRYARMSPNPDEFTKDGWEVVFYRPKARREDDRSFPDIIIAVNWDGTKTKVIKK